MLVIALAAAMAQFDADLREWGRLEFEVVAVDASGMYSVPFSQSDHRYALVRAEDGTTWPGQMLLGEADAFSPLRSSQSLPLPPGEYAIVELSGSDGALEIPGTSASRLLTIALAPGDRIKVVCSAQGSPVCAAESQNGFQQFR